METLAFRLADGRDDGGGPVAASPPAKIPLTTWRGCRHLRQSSRSVALEGRSGTSTSWPTAMMTVLASRVYSLPFTGTGRAAAGVGSPRAMRMHVTAPFSMRTGAVRNSIATPSSEGLFDFGAAAGISARVRR